ncbi:MAG: acyl carrier protein [Bacteroidia bacterium]|nr:acyl carrier protein [Bacteroidia bacterium]
MTDVVETLKVVFRKTFENKNLEITREMTAQDVSGWDSLTHVTLINNVESTFGVRFKLKEIKQMKNIGDLIDTISRHLSA